MKSGVKAYCCETVKARVTPLRSLWLLRCRGLVKIFLTSSLVVKVSLAQIHPSFLAAVFETIPVRSFVRFLNFNGGQNKECFEYHVLTCLTLSFIKLFHRKKET